MTDLMITCIACGQSNSAMRLWCDGCGRPVPPTPQPKSVNEDLTTRNRLKLYQQVLNDLRGLRDSGRVSAATYRDISTFYETQLRTIRREADERTAAQEVHQLVLHARHAAHGGRYQIAVGLLRQAIAKGSGEYQLQNAVDEVNAKIQGTPEKLAGEPAGDKMATDVSADAECQAEIVPSIEESTEDFVVAVLVQPPIATDPVQATKTEDDTNATEPLAPVLASEASHSVAEVPDVAFSEVAVSAVGATQPSLDRRHAGISFDDLSRDTTTLSAKNRLIEAASQWSSVIKPFLLDNVGWFVGAFLVVAGFVVLIVSFWDNIEQNRILMHSLVYLTSAVSTGVFFATAYLMRRKYPQLESSSNVLLTIVALLIPLVFAAAIMTSLIPTASS